MSTAYKQKRSKIDRLVSEKQNNHHISHHYPEKPTRGYRSERGIICDVFGANVRACRIAKGWNISELAQRAGLSCLWITVIEKGGCDCSIKTAFRVAEALNMPMCRLLGNTPEISAVAAFVAQDIEVADPELSEALIKLLRSWKDRGMKAARSNQTPHDGRKPNRKPERDSQNLGRNRSKA